MERRVHRKPIAFPVLRLRVKTFRRPSCTRALVLAALWLSVAATPLLAHSNGHPRRRPVDAVIVHSLGGPDCSNGSRFFKQIDGDASTWARTFAKLPLVSIHYVIDREGVVESVIPEAMAASHAVGWNQRSIGIELVNNGDGVDPFPRPQIGALLRLIESIRSRHPDVAVERVLRHSDVDRTTFSAARHGRRCSAFRRKLDPGDAFPWDDFKRTLAQRFLLAEIRSSADR